MAKQRKDPRESAPTHDEAPSGRESSGKGHPTPTRREAQEANRRPLVPTDRRAAAKANRQRQRAERTRMQRAMASGDERYYPARDKGPVRKYVRDYIDARWNAAEFFLPVSLVIVVAVLLAGSNARLALAAIASLYLLIAVAVLDTAVATLRIKKRIRAKHAEVPKGTSMYGAIRAFQLRPTRMPRPTVRRGQYPA